MKAIGNIQIEENLQLIDPTMEVMGVRYSWTGDNAIHFEIRFQGKGQNIKHQRDFTIINEGGGYLSGDDIWEKLRKLPAIKPFDLESNLTWIQKFINFFK